MVMFVGGPIIRTTKRIKAFLEGRKTCDGMTNKPINGLRGNPLQGITDLIIICYKQVVPPGHETYLFLVLAPARSRRDYLFVALQKKNEMSPEGTTHNALQFLKTPI
jgi:hypothetical protein